MLVSGRFELQFSIPFPFPFHPIIRVDSGVCTRTIFRGKDMSMSTKNIHETFRVRLDHFFSAKKMLEISGSLLLLELETISNPKRIGWE